MGTLSIVATPIGNLEDITIRAIKTLFSVDVIACEDTRRTGQLIAELAKRYPAIVESAEHPTKPELFSYYDEVEFKKMPEIIELLSQGRNVALVSDAGTPLIADPGYKLVHEAVKRGIRVESIPGPSAMVAALTVSGLPTHSFLFLGYPPEKDGKRIELFKNIQEIHKYIENTYLLYCAPHKLISTLESMFDVYGDGDIVLARELTKIHEEVWRGTIREALHEFQNPKGEFVLLFALA